MQSIVAVAVVYKDSNLICLNFRFVLDKMSKKPKKSCLCSNNVASLYYKSMFFFIMHNVVHVLNMHSLDEKKGILKPEL